MLPRVRLEWARKGGARRWRRIATRAAEPVRICVVGGGRMGVIRAGYVAGNPSSSLTCVVDEAVEGAAAFHPFRVTQYGCLEEAMQRETFDAVWIAAPTPAHKELIALAANAGKAVAVEKPVATTVKDTLECYAICEAASVPLYCSFQRRMDASYIDLARAVHEGAIGAVNSAHAVFRDHPVPPLAFLKLGGDIFMDLAVHDIDYVRWLLREDPCEVFAVTCSHAPELAQAGVADAAHAMFRFPSGAVFTLEMTRACAYGYDQRIEVTGPKGMLALLNPPRTDVVLSTERGALAARPDHSFPQRFALAFAAEVAAFVKVVRGTEAPAVTCRDSVRALHAAQMAGESARTKSSIAITYDF